MKIKILFFVLLISTGVRSQISTTSVFAPTITNAGQGDLYLATDTNELYIGLSNGTLFFIGSGKYWQLNGNSNAAATSFLGTTNDTKVTIGSNSTPILELGIRNKLGLLQTVRDYNNANQYMAYLRGVNGVSALQFEASGASLYKPIFFTTADGNFRIKGSAAGTDFFEIGSAGTNNSGSLEFITGDEGDEPFIFKKNRTTDGTAEMMRIQGQGSGSTSTVRVGINTNGTVANSVLQVGGSVSLSIRLVTASTTLTDNDYTVILKSGTYSGTAVTVPAASTCIGRIYILKNLSGADRSISPYIGRSGNSTTTIGGAGGLLSTNKGTVFSLQSDGTDWQLVSDDY